MFSKLLNNSWVCSDGTGAFAVKRSAKKYYPLISERVAAAKFHAFV